MVKELRRAVQLADKFVRKKEYKCMIPDCNKRAINSHAIEKASIKSALCGQSDVVYSVRQSFSSIL